MRQLLAHTRTITSFWNAQPTSQLLMNERKESYFKLFHVQMQILYGFVYVPTKWPVDLENAHMSKLHLFALLFVCVKPFAEVLNLLFLHIKS